MPRVGGAGRVAGWVLLGGLVALLCAQATARTLDREDPAEVLAENDPARLLGRVIRTSSPGFLSPRQALRRVRRSRVVCVGESHDHPEHHRIQAASLEALAGGASDAPLAVGLEMLPVDLQPVCDRFTSGEIGIDDLRDAVDWEETWGFPFAIYRPIFRAARDHGAELLALNCDRELVRRVAQVGVDGLAPRHLLRLPRLDLEDEAHRRLFAENVAGAHGAEGEAFERMYQAMVVWDEVMAEHAARWLRRRGPDARLLVVAGNGHVDGRVGIPARLERRTGVRPLVLVPRTYDGEEIPADRLDPAAADLVWLTPPKELPGRRNLARSGLVLADAPGEAGALVRETRAGGRAAGWGLRRGDLIVAVDGEAVGTTADLGDALGDVSELAVVRAGRRRTVRTGTRGRLF